jgi:hypothetical protein
MPFNKEEFKEDFYDAIFYIVHYKKATDYKIIWASENTNDNTMKPTGEHILLSIISGPSGVGRGEFIPPPTKDSEQTDIVGVKNLTVSMKVFYDNYSDIVDKIKLGQELPNYLALLHRKKNTLFTIDTLAVGFEYVVTIQGNPFKYTALAADTKQDVADNLSILISEATFYKFTIENGVDSFNVLSSNDYTYSSSNNIIDNLSQRYVDISIRRMLDLTDSSAVVESSTQRSGIIDFQISTTTRLHDVIEHYIEHVTMNYNGKEIEVS